VESYHLIENENVKEIIDVITKEENMGVNTLKKIWWVALRRGKIRWNYKLWMIFDFASTIVMILTYFFISFIIIPDELVKAGYTRDYFTFALIGIAFNHYVSSSIRGLARTLRFEQYFGTIESILSTPTSFVVIFAGEMLFYFMYSTAFLISAIAVGIVLGAKFVITPYTIITTIILVILMVLSNLPIGILSAAMVLKFKQGNPIAWALTWINYFFSGTYFPIHLLPIQIRLIALALPLTFSLDALRRTLMKGDTLITTVVLTDAAILMIFIIAILPLTSLIFKKVYNQARKTGTLSQY